MVGQFRVRKDSIPVSFYRQIRQICSENSVVRE